MAKLYRSNGIIEDVTPKNGNDFSLHDKESGKIIFAPASGYTPP